jgi:putative ATP-dependent endonuclease of OLD family
VKLMSVSVAGFRSIAELSELAIGAPTLVTGHNDAGKTALLDAVRFLLGDYTLLDRDRTFVYDDEPGVTSEFAQRVDETSVTGRFELSDDEQTQLGLTSPVMMRRVSLEGASPNYEVLVELPDDGRLRNLTDKTVPELLALLKELAVHVEDKRKPALLSAVQDFIEGTAKSLSWGVASSSVIKALPRVERFKPGGADDAESAIRAALQTAYKSHVDAAELKGAVRALEESLEKKLANDAEAIREHIKVRCGDIGDVQILPLVSFSTGLKQTQISVTGKKGEDVHLGQAGAGRARRVSLAVWEFTTGLLGGAGDVVLLYDEPDTHLDYAHQRDFMRVVRDQTTLPNVRMIIATHSMNLIDGVDINDVVHVRHVNHRSVIDRLGDESEVGKHLGAIASSLGLRNTVLLHERLFVGVEGPTETAVIPVLFRIATGRQLEACGIAIWACRNNEGAADFASFLVAHNRSVAFVVDADSRETKHVFSDSKLRQRGLDPDADAIYIGDPNEIEDLFSDTQWSDLANGVWPRDDASPWLPTHFADVRHPKKFSKAVLEMLRTACSDGPSGKPDVMIEMALRLREPDDIPQQLRDAFDLLIAKAS